MMAAFSQEEINYLLIVSLILRVAPLAVRVIFDQEFDPAVLHKTLNEKKFSILEPLKRKRVLNKLQWEVMFPKSGKPSSESFDMTLMICLIRHLIPTDIGDVLPADPENKSIRADLTRLKYYRNDIAHCDTGLLTDKKFEEYWRDISQVIVRFGGVGFQQRCNDLKVRRLDEGDKEILIEIRNMDRSIDPVPNGLKEIHKKTIDEWSQVVVAETRAIKRISELILTENIVVAVGSSGCGKSIAIRYVALQLQNQNQYDIIPVYSPDEIRQYYNPRCKQVFVIDDICGKSLICMDLIRKWDILSNDLNKMFERSDIKILSSCRTHIYQDPIFQNHSFLFTSSCDFASEHRLTYGERTEIANIYLNAYEINCLDESSMCKFEFFPLLCSMYRKQNSKQIHNFFCNPFLVVKDDLTSLIDVSDRKTLATLTLFIIFNNDITENFFIKSSGTRKILRRLSTWFGLEKSFSLDIVKSELDRLAQSYVKKINNSYRLLYDEIYDILLLNFGEHKLDLVLKVAHPCVIRDRFLFESLEKTKLYHDNIDTCIKIPIEKEKSYFDRLLNDIKSGLIIHVLLNKQMKHCRFYKQLIVFLSGKIHFEDILQKMNDNEKYGLFVSTIYHGYYNTLSLLLKYMGKIKSLEDFKSLEWYTDIQQWYKDTTELLEYPESSKWRGSTSTTGYFDIVKSLLNHKCDLTVYYKGKTALSIAVQKGYFDIAELLLDYKDELRHSQARCKYLNRRAGVGNSKNSTTRKYVATNTDVIVIETSMFYQIGYDYPFTSGELKCIFDFTEGLLNTVLMSLPTLSENYYSENPLYRAAKNGYTDEMQLLLENKADPDVGLMGEPPLFIAVQNGRFDAVKLLLKYEADPNIKHWNETALHIAAKKGYAHIVQLLLENKADPNIEGMFGIPMHISASNGNIDIKVKQEFYATVIQVKGLDSYTTRLNPPFST